MKAKTYNIVLICLILLIGILGSCSNAKYIPEGDFLYTKGTVTVQSDTIKDKYIDLLEEELESLIRPEPNSEFLGMRPKLYIYNIIDSPKNQNSIKGWLKYKVGEAPVFLSEVNRDYNQNLLRNKLENLGFFHAEVSSDTTIKGRQAEVNYQAKPGIIFRINSITFETDSSTLGKDIQATKENTLLQIGRNFNLSQIVSERERIDNILKNKGYYYFSADNLLIEVDSTLGNNHVDLYLKVKEETPLKARQKYTINNTYIYPNFISGQSMYGKNNPRNAKPYQGQFYFLDPDQTFRKFALARIMFFEKGKPYNRNAHSQTLNQLVKMGTFKFVKNEFKEVDTGKNLLDVYYYLTQMPKRGIRVEILGKTASIYNGSELTFNWLNRNIFKSGEVLTVTTFAGFETQRGGNVNLNSSYNRYGLELSIAFPRLIAPFSWEPTRKFVPRTFMRVGYEFLNRKSAYTLNSLKLSYDYNWKESIQKEHDLSVIEINYVQARNVSDAFKEQILNNPTLAHTISPQFTFGPNYFFTMTNTMQTEKKNTFYFKGGLDLSANTYGLIRGANFANNKIYKIFDAEFSQYIKFEGDVRHYHSFNKNMSLASRFIAGMGYSYGNSKSLPYFKQFYAGGPNGLKGFRARSVGPGSYQAPPIIAENTIFADQTGDIKLELNTEFRSKIIGFVHGAAFIDAGNIWLQRKDENKPHGEFSADFYKEIAVSGGLGLRFDFSYLVLRTDFGIPLRIPNLNEGSRWVLNKIDFGDKNWRKENLVFNLSIGYPF